LAEGILGPYSHYIKKAESIKNLSTELAREEVKQEEKEETKTEDKDPSSMI